MPDIGGRQNPASFAADYNGMVYNPEATHFGFGAPKADALFRCADRAGPLMDDAVAPGVRALHFALDAHATPDQKSRPPRSTTRAGRSTPSFCSRARSTG